MGSLRPNINRCTTQCLLATPQLISWTRSFSYTATHRKHGPLPSFPQTSSSELDSLLSTFRSNIFLPSHLPRAQRNLIYRRSLHHHLLGEDPVNVELQTTSQSSSKESFTLVPLDRFTDEPGTKSSFNKLLDLMRTKSDWDVLAGFLGGLKWSGRKVTLPMADKMIRRAGAAGRIGVITECLRQIERTGLKLDHIKKARSAMNGALQTAIISGWSDEGTTKALKQAENFLELIEDPAHVATRPASTAIDPRKAPDVVGVVMSLAAFKAAKFAEGSDEGAKVDKFAKRFLRLWGHAELGPAGDQKWWHANENLTFWGPVAHGIRSALRVLGHQSETGKELGKILQNDLEPLVRNAKTVLEQHTSEAVQRRGLVLYNELERAVI